ncbi:hypothetical protein [Sphingobacterium sp. LRF_L2]|uniref:hypothetical protein n=1 Tax=Sphingobacterium sp. LRF_L2 TaxID=3369421 RepID=UPI003F62613A
MGILLQDNRYFILDEPYNGLDLQSSIILTEIVQKLRAMEKTIIISSHIFSTLRDTCDEIYLLEEGVFKQNTPRVEFSSLEEELKERVLKLDLDKLLGE